MVVAATCQILPTSASTHILTHVHQACSKRMVHDGVKGKIVFTSSALGYFSLVGYSTYSPGKFATRGTCSSLSAPRLLESDY